MEKKKICFIAQFPPPIHGLSKAVDTLYNSELNSCVSLNGEFEFEKIDITNNKNFLKNLNSIRKSNADLFYFTISQTRMGNLRDLIILKLLIAQEKKCLVHLHGGYYRRLVDNDIFKWQKKVNYKVFSKLSGAIVLGPSLKWMFQEMLPEEKIHIVPNCIDDLYLISDKEFSQKLRKKNNSINHVLYLSNFIRSKGYLEVLKIAKLEKNYVEKGKKNFLHFDFAGKFFDKKEKSFFDNYIKENKLQDYVTYHGIVDGKEKKALLNLCTIFVLLTRYPKEGQPISILEAMGNAMMIVTTDHAGIPDIVKNNINGIVIHTYDNINISNLYFKIRKMDIALIAKKNREIIKTKFTQDKYLKNMHNIFQTVFEREKL